MLDIILDMMRDGMTATQIENVFKATLEEAKEKHKKEQRAQATDYLTDSLLDYYALLGIDIEKASMDKLVAMVEKTTDTICKVQDKVATTDSILDNWIKNMR